MKKDEIEKNKDNISGRYSRKIYKDHIEEYGVENI